VAIADLAQWEDFARAAAAEARSEANAAAKAGGARPSVKKLSYHEQREWEGMEAGILVAETAVEAARTAAEDPAVATDAAELMARHDRLVAAEQRVADLYARWAELEAKRGG
jgi:ATP-binding cassette subfamily F protein uup